MKLSCLSVSDSYPLLLLSRIPSNADTGSGAEQSVPAGLGHQPQHPLRDAEGPTERPLDPPRQRESLQHELQPSTSAGVVILKP